MHDDKRNELAGNMLVHDPLPYKLRVRVTMGEDSAPTVHDLEQRAYSIHEAMMQAVVELGGISPEDSRFKFESVEPDMPGYAKWKENRRPEAHTRPSRHI